MALKSEIKKAITLNSKWNAKKVWGIKNDLNHDGSYTLWIEVTATKKSKPKK